MAKIVCDCVIIFSKWTEQYKIMCGNEEKRSLMLKLQKYSVVTYTETMKKHRYESIPWLHV